jgi:hypothetical protein
MGTFNLSLGVDPSDVGSDGLDAIPPDRRPFRA